MIDEIDKKLVNELQDSFRRLGVECIISKQNNRFVESTGFKRGARAVYCYVLHEDFTKKNPSANLVFRFRKDENILGWFKNQNLNPLIEIWRDRLVNMWAKGSEIHQSQQDPELVTSQYGIEIIRDDLSSQYFHAALDTFLQIAIEAVMQASIRKNRDWNNYEHLIS